MIAIRKNTVWCTHHYFETLSITVNNVIPIHVTANSLLKRKRKYV